MRMPAVAHVQAKARGYKDKAAFNEYDSDHI